MCFSQIALYRACEGCKRGIIHVLEMYARPARHTVKGAYVRSIIPVHSKNLRLLIRTPMNVLDYLHVIFFGIVEGITEWLPVSSTGHMMLFNSLWSLNVSPEFYDTFLVVIQLGAILAVIAAFFRRLNPFSFRKSSAEKRATWRLWLLIVVGSIPAAIVGIALDKWIEAHIMNDASLSYKVVAGALIVYGFIFIIMELILRRRIANSSVLRGKHARLSSSQARMGNGTAAATSAASVGGEVAGGLREPGGVAENVSAAAENAVPGAGKATGTANGPVMGKATSAPVRTFSFEKQTPRSVHDSSELVASVTSFSQLSLPRAFAVGVFQCLAIIPGTSRSGAIIIGSILLGTSRTIATEFAFFLAIPIMFGWGLIKFIRHGLAFTSYEWSVLGIGVLVAFLVSLLAIKFLVGFIKRHDFTAFGVYRILIGVVALAYFMLHV